MTGDVINRAEDILEHAGVKGMKWGSRKGKKKPITRVPAGPKKSPSPTRTGRILDDMDLPFRENRRTNRMSPERIAYERGSLATRTGKTIAAAGLLAYGGVTLALIRADRAR